jgi:adenosylmethionine-8-amino-7-oxononanoate aminotransferase
VSRKPVQTRAILPSFANPVEYGRKPLVIDRAEGVYFWDTKGRRYIDGGAGTAVVNVGYGNKEIIEVMKSQIDKLTYNYLSYSLSEPAIKVAELLIRLLRGKMKQVHFTTGGSEAADTAVKIARLYHVLNGQPKRYRFIARWISYHGSTIGGLSCSGHAPRRKNFEPLLLDFPHAEPVYCYRCPLGKEYPDCAVECAKSIERVIRNEGVETISAFIAEPIVGSTGGGLVPPPEYFEIVREICDRYGILLVADEVITGFGRTGKMFAMEHWNVKPDIVMMSKGMSSGYAPIGGVAISAEIAEAFEGGKGIDFAHGFTFAGNPVACAATVKNIEIIQREKLPERAMELGEYLKEKLLALDQPLVGDVRGKGLFVGVELVKNRKTKEVFPDDQSIGAEVAELALQRGVKIFGMKGHDSGMISDLLEISPPLIIDRSQLDVIVTTIDKCLSEVKHKL